jgi:hypothetical protein
MLSFFIRSATENEAEVLSISASALSLAFSLSNRNSFVFRLEVSVRAFLKSNKHFPLFSVIFLWVLHENKDVEARIKINANRNSDLLGKTERK